MGLAGIPPNCQTVLWIDFEAAPDADEALLLPELKKVFDNLFNKEAAHFISFDGKIVPGSPPTFRLAVYFDANFWTTLTTPNAYLESLLCMSADVELTGSLADLINTKTTRPLLVRGGNANMEFDREANPSSQCHMHSSCSNALMRLRTTATKLSHHRPPTAQNTLSYSLVSAQPVYFPGSAHPDPVHLVGSAQPTCVSDSVEQGSREYARGCAKCL